MAIICRPLSVGSSDGTCFSLTPWASVSPRHVQRGLRDLWLSSLRHRVGRLGNAKRLINVVDVYLPTQPRGQITLSLGNETRPV